MLKIFQTVATGYNRYMTNMGRHKAREVLVQCSDRMLDDAGFSRELLEQGVQAWPWRIDETSEQVNPLVLDEVTKTKAIVELQSYSDVELKDLAIERSEIEQAVRNGRPGIEQDDERRVA